MVILVAAVVVGIAGVLTNDGSGHALTDNLAVFGYDVTGSTGRLFLYGIVVGAIGLSGLALLLAGAQRTARGGRSARRELQQSRRETAALSQERDDLVEAEQQRAIADPTADRALSPASPEQPARPNALDPVVPSPRWRRPFGRRPGGQPVATAADYQRS